MSMIGHNGGPPLQSPSSSFREQLFREVQYCPRLRRYTAHDPIQWQYWQERLDIAECAYNEILEAP